VYLVKTIGALGDDLSLTPVLAPRPAAQQPTVDALSFVAVGTAGLVVGALALWFWERSSARKVRRRR